MSEAGVCDGFRVVDFSQTLAGAFVTNVLADYGADVLLIEPPGGSKLRSQRCWPFLGRGKRSEVIDLHTKRGRAAARERAVSADVVVQTWRPGVAKRLGLDGNRLRALNPRLVHASITGFGRDNELSGLKAYEPIVMAKIGGLTSFAGLSRRSGPSFVTTPYCAFSAAQLALHGILGSLIERERSGLGQDVEATMAQAVVAHDPWNWLIHVISERYGGAFTAAAMFDEHKKVPNSEIVFRLLVAMSADGQWMQFSQTTNRLWRAFLEAAELTWFTDDPYLHDGPASEDPDVRIAFWDLALAAIRKKTYAEWLDVFDSSPDVWAETFREGSDLFRHPQIQHDGCAITLDDPVVGAVLQPGPLGVLTATPGRAERPAPRLDDHDHGWPAALEQDVPAVARRGANQPPLQGITILELGTFFAAPYGATILAELGARVIKLEALDGDPIRNVMPFPEMGGIKVLHGKESVAVDLSSAAGRAIALELARRSDVVLQTFRAGAADRLCLGRDDLIKVNPDLIYVDAQGYGNGPPCGHRPAFAPTIGAASGTACRNLGGFDHLPMGTELTLDEIKTTAMSLSSAAMAVAHADGFAALTVATNILLGLLNRKRAGRGQATATSMIATMLHVHAEVMTEYEGAAAAVPDPELYGLGPLYRLYEADGGWVFLAAPDPDDWALLANELGIDAGMRNDQDLAVELAKAFASSTAPDWEQRLTAHDIACVAVAAEPMERTVMVGDLGRRLGWVCDASHPTFDIYPRMTPLVGLSRSATVTGAAPLCGAHTQSVLRELGYADEDIRSLAEDRVIDVGAVCTGETQDA